MPNRQPGSMRALNVPSPDEMLEEAWPRTPGRARYEEAQRRYNLASGSLPGENPDDAAFRALWNTQTYQNEASRMLYERAQYEETTRDWTLNLMDLASSGTTRDAIGIGVELTMDGPEGPGSRPVRLFGRFPKHPDWMGMCNALAHVQGKHAEIFESLTSEHAVGTVIVTNTDNWDDPDREDDPPTQEIRMLRDLLIHHGASSCRWVPMTGFQQDENNLIEQKDWKTQTRIDVEPEDGRPTEAAVSIETMNDWPCTPGRTRSRAANRMKDRLQMGIITPDEADPQTLADVAALNLISSGTSFQTTIVEEFIARTQGDVSTRDFFGIVIELASRADRENTIGFASQFNQGSHQGVVFAELPRDPTWMGMNPVLPTVEGNLVSIRQSTLRPGEPGVVLSFIIGPDLQIPEQPEEAFPEGAATLLKNVLQWHGARVIHWTE